MSKHVTTLPIDLSTVIAALPPRSSIDGISMSSDHKTIELHWQNDASKTGRTYPIEYPIEKLEELADKVASPKGKLVKPTLWPFKKPLTPAQ